MERGVRKSLVLLAAFFTVVFASATEESIDLTNVIRIAVAGENSISEQQIPSVSGHSEGYVNNEEKGILNDKSHEGSALKPIAFSAPVVNAKGADEVSNAPLLQALPKQEQKESVPMSLAGYPMPIQTSPNLGETNFESIPDPIIAPQAVIEKNRPYPVKELIPALLVNDAIVPDVALHAKDVSTIIVDEDNYKQIGDEITLPKVVYTEESPEIIDEGNAETIVEESIVPQAVFTDNIPEKVDEGNPVLIVDEPIVPQTVYADIVPEILDEDNPRPIVDVSIVPQTEYVDSVPEIMVEPVVPQLLYSESVPEIADEGNQHSIVSEPIIPQLVYADNVPDVVNEGNREIFVDEPVVSQTVYADSVPEIVDEPIVPQAVYADNVPANVDEPTVPQLVYSEIIPENVDVGNPESIVGEPIVPQFVYADNIPDIVNEPIVPQAVYAGNVPEILNEGDREITVGESIVPEAGNTKIVPSFVNKNEQIGDDVILPEAIYTHIPLNAKINNPVAAEDDINLPPVIYTEPVQPSVSKPILGPVDEVYVRDAVNNNQKTPEVLSTGPGNTRPLSLAGYPIPHNSDTVLQVPNVDPPANPNGFPEVQHNAGIIADEIAPQTLPVTKIAFSSNANEDVSSTGTLSLAGYPINRGQTQFDKVDTGLSNPTQIDVPNVNNPALTSIQQTGHRKKIPTNSQDVSSDVVQSYNFFKQDEKPIQDLLHHSTNVATDQSRIDTGFVGQYDPNIPSGLFSGTVSSVNQNVTPQSPTTEPEQKYDMVIKVNFSSQIADINGSPYPLNNPSSLVLLMGEVIELSKKLDPKALSNSNQNSNPSYDTVASEQILETILDRIEMANTPTSTFDPVEPEVAPVRNFGNFNTQQNHGNRFDTMDNDQDHEYGSYEYDQDEPGNFPPRYNFFGAMRGKIQRKIAGIRRMNQYMWRPRPYSYYSDY